MMSCISRAFLFSAIISVAFCCSRVPIGTTAGKSPADDRYIVTIGGNPQNFEPGQKYNVTLMAVQGYSFIGFMLAVENENPESKNGNVSDHMNLGYFEISDYSETKFSDKCANLVTHTNMLPKSRIQVVWTAPPPGSGCVLFRATVIEHREVWYMDDGFLTKQFCEEQQDDIDNQPAVMNPCCACDEAKYELTFEGKWSRHTHPKDFPANSWKTKFSDIIGASHTIDYRFWQYGELASEGLREVAEHGSTRTLESELKEQSDQIRTIIKARGIAFPNVTGKTFAVFRVDSKHHLISLVSMVDPSPDWIVGVSGLELCLPNCSWVEHKVHNLYPWDIGTDSGPSYMSADQPQVPPDVIRRIKSNFPNDPRSPFYDPAGTPMKPLARLHISRRRLYEKTCDNLEANDPIECSTHPWSRWSECSTKCGAGKQYRTRDFKNPVQANRFKCMNTLREHQNCQGRQCGQFDDENFSNVGGGFINTRISDAPECALSEWSEWSSCSATCGKGKRVKTRHYLSPNGYKKCQSVIPINLEFTDECEGLDCGGDIYGGDVNGNGGGYNGNEYEGGSKYFDSDANIETDENNFNTDDYDRRSNNRLESDEEIPKECMVNEWSSWTPCSASCGEGHQSREREVWNKIYGYDNSGGSDDPCTQVRKQEIVNCTISDCNQIVPNFCYQEPSLGPCRSNTESFWYFDYRSDHCALFFTGACSKTDNKFTSMEECEKTCKPKPVPYTKLSIGSLRLVSIDCLVSDWRVRVPCNVTCGEGSRIKERKVIRSPKNGGKPCPKRLVKTEKCYARCPEEIYDDVNYNRRRQIINSKEIQECIYSQWSPWSPCTASCGDNSNRQRTRNLINIEMNQKCKERVEIVKCNVMPCLISSRDCRGVYC